MYMEQNFATMFEDIRYERSLILLLSLIDPDTIRQTKITDFEIKILQKLALQNIHRQRNVKEFIALDLLGKHFSN